MKTKKILFVGGPSDGLRREDPVGNPNYTMVATFSALNGPVVPLDQGCVGMDTHTYTRKQFRTNKGTTLEAFFHSSITDPMEALLKGYRYHRNPRTTRGRGQVLSRKKLKAFYEGCPPYDFDSKLVLTSCTP